MHHQSRPVQALPHIGKYLLAYLVFLQQVAELEQRRGIRSLLRHEVQPHEPAHGDAVAYRILHTLFSFNDFLPVDVFVSDGKMSDNDGAYHVLPGRRSIVMADRGYDDTRL